MEDFFADLYDDDNKNDDEPSFSLYEFKKWLSKQKKVKKEELKDKLKKRIQDKARKQRED